MMRFIILVEGSDDLHTIKNVLKWRGIDLNVQKDFNDCGGVEPLLKLLPTYVKGTYDALAVVMDADLNLEARWQAVRERLRDAGYDVPETPVPGGTVLSGDPRLVVPRVGVWLMPDNILPGSLEHFAEKLIPDGDELWPRARTVVADIPPDSRRFTSAIKAEIHTWLAWQEEPGTPLGLAITKRYLLADAAAADAFVAWIRQLRDEL